MALTTEEIQMLQTDELTGRPHRVQGKNADEFLKQFRKERKQMEQDNMVVDVVKEWEVSE